MLFQKFSREKYNSSKGTFPLRGTGVGQSYAPTLISRRDGDADASSFPRDFELTRKTNSTDFLTDPCGVIYARIRLRWFAPSEHTRGAPFDRKSRVGKARSRAVKEEGGV